MKTRKLLWLVSMIIISVCKITAQPGEESDKKYNIHEIKLQKREDGSKVGAIAWTTASPDSVQKFVIRNLSIMEPVQVLLQALSPNDEVSLQFVKEKWSEPESSISAKGKDIGKKIFRTYKTAAMGINAKKAGVPYIILVQVGKKLPVNSMPLFRITNDKNEYEAYLKNKGKTTVNKTDTEAAVIPIANTESGSGNGPNNSSLLYIIIGLLALMVALLVYFIFVRKGGKKVFTVVFILSLGISPSWSQEGGPIQLPVENTGDGSRYTDAGITGMINQGFIVDLYERLSEQAAKLADLDDSYDYLNEQLNNLEEMVLDNNIDSGETDSELFSAYHELKNEFETFKNNFADNMPGEYTEGGTRTIPPNISQAELNRIRARIRDLERQVEFLSDRDREQNPEENNQEPVILYCESIIDCMDCIDRYLNPIYDLREKFLKLNRVLRQNDWEMEYAIDTGNNLANMAPGMALGWQQQYKNIQMARKGLWSKYHDKYDELRTRYDNLIEGLNSCNDTFNPEGEAAYNWQKDAQGFLQNEAPELPTPML